MAIYHLSVKPVSRSAGRSSTAAAAYRSGEKIVDERTGEIHDYTRKKGVESTDLILPEGAPEWAGDRSKLWNAAEAAEKRKDACVAREYEVALPAELSPAERRALALEFARDMATRERCAVDVAIHAPGKDGDQQNYHAHILRTTRKVEADGLGEKLDTEKAGRHRKDDLEAVRERWAALSNAALERAGHGQRIDHRSLENQGIDREPTKHLGPAATEYERRTGEPSEVRIRHQLDALERLTRAKELGDLERESRAADKSVIDLSGDLKAAVAERDRRPTPEAMQAGLADFRKQLAAHQLAKERAAQQAAAYQAEMVFARKLIKDRLAFHTAKREEQEAVERAAKQVIADRATAERAAIERVAAERLAQQTAKQQDQARRKAEQEQVPRQLREAAEARERRDRDNDFSR